MQRWITLGFLLVVCEKSYSADHALGQRWSAGVAISQVNYELSTDTLNNVGYVLADPSETRVDNKSGGYAIQASYSFLRYLSMELGYADYGKLSYHLGSRTGYQPYQPPNCSTGCQSPLVYPPGDYSEHAIAIRSSVVGSLPIANRWSLDARIGLAVTRWEMNGPTDDGHIVGYLALVYGVGVSYSVSEPIRLRLNVDKYRSEGGGPVTYEQWPKTNQAAFLETVDMETVSLVVEYRW